MTDNEIILRQEVRRLQEQNKLLQLMNLQLKQQNEKMKCCENCKYKQCGMKEIFKAIKEQDETKVCKEWKLAE